MRATLVFVVTILGALFLANTALASDAPAAASPRKEAAPAATDQAPLFNPLRGRFSLGGGEEGSWQLGGSFATTHSALGSRKGSNNAANVLPDDGFNGEFALFGHVQAGPKVSASVRVCYGCHQLDVESAYFRYDLSDYTSFRAGRFVLPFGSANARHDQAVRRGVSKPLPFMMGGMVRQGAFNHGVIPSPAIDNGVGLTLNPAFGESFGLSLDFFAVRGLVGGGTDVNFIASRDFEDNNGEPAGGMRLDMNLLGISFGSTYMVGNHDADGSLGYQLLTADFAFELLDVQFEGLYAQRSTEYTDGTGQAHFWKRGYWAQASWRMAEDLLSEGDIVTAFLSADGLFVSDIWLGNFGPTDAAFLAITDRSNQLNRYSAGLVWRPDNDIQFKAAFEFWNFSDFKDATVWQLAAVWSF